MSSYEDRVTELLDELAHAAPVRTGEAPLAATGAPHPDYVAPASSSSRRRPLLVAAAVVAVLSVVGAALVLGRTSGPSPVVARPSDLAVDTAALGAGRMAVVIENQLYVADGPSGQVWQLTDTGDGEEVSDVSFSHDGEWVAFTIHDESGLWVSRWDGTEQHRIGRSPSSYTWSPTDDQLAYATQDEVRVAQTDGTSRALEGGFEPKPFTNVVWSPDGRSLAFVHSDYGTGTAGTAIATLAGNEGAGWGSPYQYSVFDAGEVVAWTPDDKLVVTAGAMDGSPATTLQVGLLLSVDTVELVPVLPTDPLLVAVSPRGAESASLFPGTDRVDRCDLGTFTCVPATIHGARDRTSVPAFSPDGTSIALLGQDSAGRMVLTATDRPAGAEGVVLSSAPRWWPRYGTVLEPPQWLDDARLLVRTADGVDVVDVSRSDAPRSTVVEGERFLPPADDYPGGTGLAYWAPR